MDLNLLEVDKATADGHDHLLTVTGAVVAVGRRQLQGVGTILLQETALAEVCGVATGSENDGAFGGTSLTIPDVFDTNDGSVVVLDQLLDVGLFDDFDAIGLGFREILELLLRDRQPFDFDPEKRTSHESVCDLHSWELSVATVGAGLAVTAETRHLFERKIERIVQPIDGLAGLAGENFDKIVTGQIAGGSLGVVEKDFGRIINLVLCLRFRASSVDSRGCLCGVAT